MATHRVQVLALPDVQPMELGMPFQVLAHPGLTTYDVRVCSTRTGAIPTAGGFAIEVKDGLESLELADTVIVPAYRHPQAPLPTEVLAALRAAHARGARMVSICVGAFALAQAGLLDGRRVTTHWRWAADLALAFPHVSVDADVLFIDTGDVITAAGVAAGIDVCLHLVRIDHGAFTANEVARQIVAAPHREGGQAQFIERSVPAGPTGGLTATREWALSRLNEPLTVRELANHARMSERSLSRGFVAQTGLSPLRWLTVARVNRARELLETTEWGVDRIAAEAGLGTGANLRVQMRRVVATSPSDYRAGFRRD